MHLLNKIVSLPLWAHLAGSAAVFAGFQIVKGRLDALYAASKHPVDYATGQTTFNAETVKGYYAHMTSEGTLATYVQTQQFDYLFMVFLALLGIALGTLFGRLGQPGSLGRKLGFAAAILAVAGACLDALENAVSFVMLSNPQGFADWLVMPYSGFAAAKFGCITLALLCLVLSLLSSGISGVARALKAKT